MQEPSLQLQTPPFRQVHSGHGVQWWSSAWKLLFHRGVITGERALRGEVRAEVRKRLARQQHRALHRVERHSDRLPQVLEVAVARIREQQRQRQQPEKCEPRKRRGTAMKEWWRLDRYVAHGSATGRVGESLELGPSNPR